MIAIFNNISNRMLTGICFHMQMADYFDFLDLHGLKRMHENQSIKELSSYRGLHRYVINHCGKIIDDSSMSPIKYIPNSWYNSIRTNVDNSTRRQAVKESFEKWHNLEIETKQLFEKSFKELTTNGKIMDANKVNELICDVSDELKQLCRKLLEYRAVDYDMTYIMYQQGEMHEKYEKELESDYHIKFC